jgi:hypothetical protein
MVRFGMRRAVVVLLAVVAVWASSAVPLVWAAYDDAGATVDRGMIQCTACGPNAEPAAMGPCLAQLVGVVPANNVANGPAARACPVPIGATTLTRSRTIAPEPSPPRPTA